MAKIRVPSWLHSSHSHNNTNGNSTNASANSQTDEVERKKQNRLSLSGLAGFISKNDQSSQPSSSSEAEITPSATSAPGNATFDSHTSAMIQLANKITQETEKLDKYIKENNLPEPGFGADAPTDFPKLPDDIQKSRQEIVYATKELGQLVRGPREQVRWGVWNVSFVHYCPLTYRDSPMRSFSIP